MQHRLVEDGMSCIHVPALFDLVLKFRVHGRKESSAVFLARRVLELVVELVQTLRDLRAVGGEEHVVERSGYVLLPQALNLVQQVPAPALRHGARSEDDVVRDGKVDVLSYLLPVLACPPLAPSLQAQEPARVHLLLAHYRSRQLIRHRLPILLLDLRRREASMPCSRQVDAPASPVLPVHVEETERNVLGAVMELEQVVEEVGAGKLECCRAFGPLDEKIIGEVEACKAGSSYRDARSRIDENLLDPKGRGVDVRARRKRPLVPELQDDSPHLLVCRPP
mmetsp:Transcript_9605/g.21848  ORF Transcript_9605/g.21848 Transcript_9605/m.21848 type:complete len:280 (-) Transcript_9605:1001-1840(-)